MPDSMPKSMAPLMIFQILWELSDPEHPLTQAQIVRELEARGLELDRKAVMRQLKKLMEWDAVTIKCRSRKGLSSQVGTDFYLDERPFTDTELRLIVDSLSANPFIDSKTTRELVHRLTGLSSRYFAKKVRHYDFMNDRGKTENRETLDLVDIIGQAIDTRQKIRYTVLLDDRGKKAKTLAGRRTSSPVQLLVKGEEYYLLCIDHICGENHLLSFPLRRMTDARVLPEPATGIESVPGYERGIDYDKLLREHPDLRHFHGSPRLCTFHCEPYQLNVFRAHFGTQLRVIPFTHTETVTAASGEVRQVEIEMLEVSVITDPQAAVQFALQNPQGIWLIAPDNANRLLRRRLQQKLHDYRQLQRQIGAGVPPQVWKDRADRDKNHSLADAKGSKAASTASSILDESGGGEGAPL